MTTTAAAKPEDEFRCSTTTRNCRKELHIAPMLHVSTVEFRELFRILSKRCILWTEMIVDETLVYNTLPDASKDKRPRSPPEHLLPPPTSRPTTTSTKPGIIICQLGGIRPDWTAIASRWVVAAGYKYEINLNLDCPSNRVQGKQFGAVLLKDVERVVSLLSAMKEEAGTVPISVKMRVGIIDDAKNTDFQWLVRMVERLSSVCRRFIIHARAVVLKGLSPEQNRNIPPLNYPFVYELCERFPHLDFWINGGILGLKSAKDIVYGLQQGHKPDSQQQQQEQQKHHVPCSLCEIWNGSCVAPPRHVAPCNLRGCLLARAAMDNPAQFWDTDRYFYGETDTDNPCHRQTRRQILDAYCAILEDLYPRRCCDEMDDQVTCQLPSPRVVFTKEHCDVCRELSSSNNHPLFQQRQKDGATHIKITSHVMDRSLKPFLGMFFGLPGSRAFRRRCEELSRNLAVRNCGPAFVLRLAVNTTVSDAILDQPMVRTEDLLL
jgi:tRNA-dihydrouridine synthase A